MGALDAFDLTPGTYRVSVDLASARDDTPANYLLRINTLDSATALTIGTTVSAERALPRQTDLYEFDATAGDRFYIAVAATSANRVPALKLIDPLGQQVSVVSGRPNTYETALTGTYRLAVVAPTGLTADAAADTYDVSVTPISSVADQTSALTFGQPVTSTISSPGESRIFNFTVDQYGSYFVDSLTNTRSLALNLTNEQGTSFLNRFFNSLDSFDRYPVLNLAPGNYSITVTGTGDFVGDFGFTFTPVESATTIVPNSPQAISIAGVETFAFKFDAAEGTRSSLTWSTASTQLTSGTRWSIPTGFEFSSPTDCAISALNRYRRPVVTRCWWKAASTILIRRLSASTCDRPETL